MTDRGQKKRENFNWGQEKIEKFKNNFYGRKMIGNKLTIVHLNKTLTTVR